MIGLAVVLLMAGGWLLALLAVGAIVGRFCGLNDRLPPPRRWVDEQSGRTARVSFTRAEDGAPLPSGQNPVPLCRPARTPLGVCLPIALADTRPEQNTPGRHTPPHTRRDRPMIGRCTKHGVVRISHERSQALCHLPDAVARYETFLVEWADGRRARPHMNAPQGGATCGRVLSWTEEST